jgi:benzoyl-CoA reductase subunit C
VVGEDHDWGDRHSAGKMDITSDPIDGIVDRYHLRQPGAHQSTVSERVTALLEDVRATDAQGVIAFIYDADDAPSWDFPEQRRALESEGVPVLLLDRQPYKLVETDELRDRVEAFVGSIARGGQPARGAGGEVSSHE